MRETTGLNYYIRNDLPESLPSALVDDAEEIFEELLTILQGNLPEAVRVVPLEAEEQVKATFPNPTISLDTLWEGDYALAISRRFRPASGQARGAELVNRPGTPSLEEQIARIPPGEYNLVDDDVATGYTVSCVRELLEPHGVRIASVNSLTPRFDSFLDVVDARDFILGARNGGLVMRLRGEVTRMPYMLPYVNLHSRAKIPLDRVRALSNMLWNLNAYVHAGSGLTVGDIREHQDFTLVGFPEDMLVSDLAEGHLVC